MLRIVVTIDEPVVTGIPGPVPLQEIRAELLHGGKIRAVPDCCHGEVMAHAASTAHPHVSAGPIDGVGSAAAGLAAQTGRKAVIMCAHPPSTSAIRLRAAWS